MSMTAVQFCKLGEALRGPCWKKALAADLGVDERTVKRWAAKDHPISPEIADAVVKLLASHARKLAALAKEYEA